MKATGIVRRIDDLGRVVIPKEIRRTMRIREGDPLEIYTNSEGEVIFRKYSAVSEMSENAASVAEIMHKIAGCPVMITDKDKVVASSGVPKKELADRRVSVQLEDLMQERSQFFSESGSKKPFLPAEGSDISALAAMPIISGGDVSGAVVFFSADRNNTCTDLQKSLITAASQFLSRQIPN